MSYVLIEFVNLLLAGILAGEEFVICYGVRAPLAVLDQGPHIQLRQALIRRLGVLVPILFVMTAASGVALLLLGGHGSGFGFRCAAVLALLTFILITFFGTVPINKGALAWRLDAPPGNWRALVDRWERLDIARCWAAVLAFAFFLTAVALQVAGP
jgi:hypothetical protein